MTWNRAELTARGFTGFVPFAMPSLLQVPKVPGVYALVHTDNWLPVFRATTTVGRRSGKPAPAVPISMLRGAWVEDASVLYLGKAGSHTGSATLHSRVEQYLGTGAGGTAHTGGRYIWQLDNPHQLLLAWQPTPREDPEAVEDALLEAFSADHGSLPFANIRGPRRRGHRSAAGLL